METSLNQPRGLPGSMLIYQRVSFVRGMNIHKSQLFWCKQNFDAELVGFDLSPYENLFGRHSLLGDPPKMRLGFINHQQSMGIPGS